MAIDEVRVCGVGWGGQQQVHIAIDKVDVCVWRRSQGMAVETLCT